MYFNLTRIGSKNGIGYKTLGFSQGLMRISS